MQEKVSSARWNLSSRNENEAFSHISTERQEMVEKARREVELTMKEEGERDNYVCTVTDKYKVSKEVYFNIVIDGSGEDEDFGIVYRGVDFDEG